MKPLAIFINIAGPINNPEHGMVHQVEIGIKQSNNGKDDTSRFIIKEGSTAKAIEVACGAVKSFVEKYYPKQSNLRSDVDLGSPSASGSNPVAAPPSDGH